MEFSALWTCGCGAINEGDVFFGTCWKCQASWAEKALHVEQDPDTCSACGATNGFHTLHCPTHPTPGFEPKAKKFED